MKISFTFDREPPSSRSFGFLQVMSVNENLLPLNRNIGTITKGKLSQMDLCKSANISSGKDPKGGKICVL